MRVRYQNSSKINYKTMFMDYYAHKVNAMTLNYEKLLGCNFKVKFLHCFAVCIKDFEETELSQQNQGASSEFPADKFCLLPVGEPCICNRALFAIWGRINAIVHFLSWRTR